MYETRLSDIGIIIMRTLSGLSSVSFFFIVGTWTAQLDKAGRRRRRIPHKETKTEGATIPVGMVFSAPTSRDCVHSTVGARRNHAGDSCAILGKWRKTESDFPFQTGIGLSSVRNSAATFFLRWSEDITYADRQTDDVIVPSLLQFLPPSQPGELCWLEAFLEWTRGLFVALSITAWMMAGWMPEVWTRVSSKLCCKPA